jgi:iron(III) transport system ATP-binding protein
MTTAKAPLARLSFERVSRRFGTHPAVHDVSLAVEAGEVLCLLGPSGCGKTTLLRIAAGIERQDAGRVVIDGTEVAGPARVLPPEARNVGLVFQDYALFPHLSILDNVRFGLAGRPSPEARSTALAALEAVGLARLADSYPHRLSGGEQQRAALARALVPQPRVLLMDEPFSGLDTRLRDRVRDDTMSLLRAGGATAVVVTHDPEEAMRIGDRIALMRAGRLVQLGTPEDLYQRPVDLEAARFFCETNEIAGRVEGGRVVTPLGSFALDGVPAAARRAGDHVVAGVRPHDLIVSGDAAGAEGVVATVLGRHFLGGVDHLDLAVEGLEGPLWARVPHPGRHRPGDRVRVSAEAPRVLFFAD